MVIAIPALTSSVFSIKISLSQTPNGLTEPFGLRESAVQRRFSISFAFGTASVLSVLFFLLKILPLVYLIKQGRGEVFGFQ